MGLGKTMQIIWAIHNFFSKKGGDSVIILGPKSIVEPVWGAELKKWLG
jgi:hypothetical protein